jgi:ribosomal protein L37E
MSMTRSRLRPYCLRCYTPIGEESSTCSVCGYSNPQSMRQRYWTREPWIVQMEAALKVGIAVLVPVSMLVIALVQRHLGWMAGWLLAGPMFLAFPAWMTASRLTARGGNFSATGFWVAAFLLAAVGCPCASGSLGLAIVPVVFAILTLCGSASFRRWKEEKILRGRPPGREA